MKSNLKIIVYGKNRIGIPIKIREHSSWREATGSDLPMSEEKAKRICQGFTRVGLCYESIEVSS